MRLHHKAANPVAQKTPSASATPASEGQNPQSPSQPQSHASNPVDVTFPRRLPELPCEQVSLEVLESLGYTPEVPSQYTHDQMEHLGPMYMFDLCFTSLCMYLDNQNCQQVQMGILSARNPTPLSSLGCRHRGLDCKLSGLLDFIVPWHASYPFGMVIPYPTLEPT